MAKFPYSKEISLQVEALVTAFALNSPTSLALILVPTEFYALEECEFESQTTGG